jgi:hypothetical protein
MAMKSLGAPSGPCASRFAATWQLAGVSARPAAGAGFLKAVACSYWLSRARPADATRTAPNRTMHYLCCCGHGRDTVCACTMLLQTPLLLMLLLPLPPLLVLLLPTPLLPAAAGATAANTNAASPAVANAAVAAATAATTTTTTATAAMDKEDVAPVCGVCSLSRSASLASHSQSGSKSESLELFPCLRRAF